MRWRALERMRLPFSHSSRAPWASVQSSIGRHVKHRRAAAVQNYLNDGTWELVGEFTEVESWRKSERSELAKALDGGAIRIR